VIKILNNLNLIFNEYIPLMSSYYTRTLVYHYHEARLKEAWSIRRDWRKLMTVSSRTTGMQELCHNSSYNRNLMWQTLCHVIQFFFTFFSHFKNNLKKKLLFNFFFGIYFSDSNQPFFHYIENSLENTPKMAPLAFQSLLMLVALACFSGNILFKFFLMQYLSIHLKASH